jgi:hypothetical protein
MCGTLVAVARLLPWYEEVTDSASDQILQSIPVTFKPTRISAKQQNQVLE